MTTEFHKPAESPGPTDSFSYMFAALRGEQAGREYFVAMCPLKLIPKIFLFDEGEIPPELRAQRTLNRARVPEMSQYLTENPTEYVFSAITASIDGDVTFTSINGDGLSRNVGQLVVPMTSRFIINDGQHRRAAIEEALKERPELGDETIAVVFFLDPRLERSQQMFADLNKHAVRPSKSLGILYDYRDPQSRLAKKLMSSVSVFNGLTETEKISISNRSIKLFTLSSIYQGTRALLNKPKNGAIAPREEKLATDFWAGVASHMPDWQLARERKVSAAELRRDYIHAHGIALHSLGLMGHGLVASEPARWRERLAALEGIDWRRANTKLWEGTAMIGGRVSKAHNNVLLTTGILKRALKVPLTPEEKRLRANLVKATR